MSFFEMLDDNMILYTTSFLMAREGSWGPTWDVARETIALCRVGKRASVLFRDFFGIIGFSSHTELVEKVKREKETKITKTMAMQKYHLTDKDLVGLDHELCTNPRFRSSAPMKLFFLLHIVRASIRKWGSKSNMETTLAIKEERARQRRVTKASRENKRRNDLVKALRGRGLALRGDSRVCEEFIVKGKRKLDEVVDTMEEMKFFHEHTNYRECYAQERRCDLEDRGRYDPDEVSAFAKAMAMKTFTEGIPGAHPPACLPRSLHDQFYHIKGLAQSRR